MPHRHTTRDGWFVDPQGRRLLLRGVNLSGSCKVPFAPDGATHRGVDFRGWKEVSFVGRPFPLADADRHLARIAHWGFDVLRLLVTWEAIEHAGPGDYDEAYLDYVRAVVRKAGEHGLLVFIDPHHDVWSRWTGGDGAPYWCFEEAGLLADRFERAQAVELDAFDWPSNYGRVPVAAMWTLFFGGDAFCPALAGAQARLQEAYLGAVRALGERLADLENLLGWDSFNEPSYGYIGRGEDLTSGRRMFQRGPEPFSPLAHLAAADGVAVRHADGRVLNPEGVSIWRDGCPWRRAGVWDLDARGEPALLRPDYFTRREGRPVVPWTDFCVPFIRRFREAIRRVQPDAIVFFEGPPTEFDTPWDDPDPLVCNARHWYDIASLATREFDPERYRAFGREISGIQAIADFFAQQLGGLARVNRERMGNPPLLLGEFGIPYEMNDGEAYRTGDWSKHEMLLDANYRALDAHLLHSTQWNYTSDNTHVHGDQWNREDLSIYSVDDDRDPSDPDSGGRAVRGFCRPTVRAAAGRPLAQRFDPAAGTFELEVDLDPAVAAPTLVYLPRIHYPTGAALHVSTGGARWDRARQLVTWEAHGARGPAMLRATRGAAEI
jgi:hypothetical protein